MPGTNIDIWRDLKYCEKVSFLSYSHAKPKQDIDNIPLSILKENVLGSNNIFPTCNEFIGLSPSYVIQPYSIMVIKFLRVKKFTSDKHSSMILIDKIFTS